MLSSFQPRFALHHELGQNSQNLFTDKKSYLCKGGLLSGINGITEILDHGTLVIKDLEAEGEEVIRRTGGSVDLNATQNGNLALTSDRTTSGLNNGIHELLLGIIQSIGELGHLILGSLEMGGVGKKGGADKVLLSIIRNLGRSVLGGGTGVDLADVAGGGDGRTAARTAVGTAATLDGTDLAGGVDADVGAEDDEAGAAVGNVRGHGTEGGDTAEGEAF